MEQSDVFRPRPAAEYYRLYDTQDSGRDKRRFFREAMSVVRDRIGDILFRSAPVHLGMFGSATPRNLEDAIDFLAETRPQHIGQDRISIVERDHDRCHLHAQHAYSYRRNDVNVLEADMNTPVLMPASVDILLIDYTLAFNVALKGVLELDERSTDALYRLTLGNAAAALAPHGAIVLNVNVLPEDVPGDYHLRFEPAIRTYATAIREQHLRTILGELGLDAGYAVEVPTIVWKPAKRMIVRRESQTQRLPAA